MSQLSPRALTMAIRAVDAELCRLDAELDSAGDDADPDTQEIHLCYDLAASDLEDAYRPLCERFSNLVPYEQLVTRIRWVKQPPPIREDGRVPEGEEEVPRPLSPRALTMAIQAVAVEMRLLRDTIASTGEDTRRAEDLPLYEDYARAAEELKEAYLPLCERYINMVPYERLVGGGSSDDEHS
ncbi:hypothetical protein JY651_26260 [Pyxidicoccus parkwayensis]|uniref:Uncharacterized protein n=1 Tax=Pyxidicoccus parkwayensis TaxID=2813578 RepID=A0ABX7NKE0_9BACT|nr:hypothetical protein [Pyxidicoccus parkwaysis]QSQ18864.1 hypothetical protein JY651_26260 [Pyxidicoccus parkwaysis]